MVDSSDVPARAGSAALAQGLPRTLRPDHLPEMFFRKPCEDFGRQALRSDKFTTASRIRRHQGSGRA